uniref:Uncharacterized protein n=1 Tax=Exserohilum turcicum mymonavirus 1 TaxID=3229033 RepID=A0AAU7YE11_9MONO
MMASSNKPLLTYPLCTVDAYKRITAIVLPTATGKTFITSNGVPTWIKEVDQVCHVRETVLLSDFRDRAKLTGNWIDYDRALGTRLRMRMDDGDVVLLASEELAHAIGAQILGYGVLKEELWMENVKKRGVKLKKYLDCYNKARNSTNILCESYGDLYNLVINLSTEWRALFAGKC